MTIVGSGPLNLATIGAEYGAPATNLYQSQLHRGHGSGYVRANSGDNGAVNHSAGVPATYVNLYIGNFYGQGKGWTYTNNTVRYNNYYPHGEFGSDWVGANGTNWPCFYVNNNAIVATSNGYYAMILYGRQNNGPFTFTNNHEIQAGGGAPNSGAGQHAIYLYNSESASYANRPIIVNNYAIRGGGGAGGVGGQGGTGGQGFYDTAYTASDGPRYTLNSYECRVVAGGDHGVTQVYWGGLIYNQYAPPYHPITIGAYTYYTGAQRASYSGGGAGWEVTRKWPASSRTYTSGGGGGAGGNGGRGIGWNSANQGGLGGAGGGAPQTNAGWGGTGGTGGTGGSWGAGGNTGATGNAGGGGNYTGGAAGAGGGGGGAAGGSVYAATQWGFVNNNTVQGPWWYAVSNS